MSIIYSVTTHIGALIKLDHSRMTGNDWSLLFSQFADRMPASVTRYDVSEMPLDPNYCHNGVYWDESFSREGVRIALLKLPDITDTMLASVKSKLRRERDVTGFSVVRIDKLIEFEYKYLNEDKSD
jgi:hypothetical protein